MNIKQQRKKIYAEINALQDRSATGEDVTAELREAGKRLDNLGKSKHRVDVMDVDVINNIDRETKERVKITLDMVEVAKLNGISADLLKKRYYTMRWSLERALTQVPQKHKPTAAQAGLSPDIYKALKASGKVDIEIRKSFGIGNDRFYKFKQENGLIQKAGDGLKKANHRKSGDIYRPYTVVLDSVDGKPTKIEINGKVYKIIENETVGAL